MQQFIYHLKQSLTNGRIIEDEMLRFAYATDASLYRLIPELVIWVTDETEVTAVIKLAHDYQLPLTFRAAGTSLSGQAVTDKILVVLAPNYWQNYHISPAGHLITLEPGIIGARANQYLEPYQRKIGPDPGSINAAAIGGIIANNSSGMCCGTANNSYATLHSLRAILANGSVLDSSSPHAIHEFKQHNPDLISKIQQLQAQIQANPQLCAFIRQKFAIKNTSGYSLNAFLDFNDPIKIIERLLVGSEGTLAFISQVTLATIADHPTKAINLVHGRLTTLINLTLAIAKLDIDAIELLDSVSLQAVAEISQLQPYLYPVTTSEDAALLIAISAAKQEDLLLKQNKLNQIISQFEIAQQTGFSQDPTVAHILWQTRKGVLPLIAAKRPAGSSVLIEDVAVAIEALPALINDLHQLFQRYHYFNAAIFGHVLAGNIHFVLTPSFSNPNEVVNYTNFMQEFCQLVVNQYHGSLKAEHGSGRNIAPFALLEWGEECFKLMWDIKQAFDPAGILNPNVKLSHNSNLHLEHLKTYVPLTAEIDNCMDCGFCEAACPATGLSLTPRQRNAVARHLPTLSGQQATIWQRSFNYHGIDTCATTGMCQSSCPVGINTGAYILSQKPAVQPIKWQHKTLIKQTKTQLAVANGIASLIGKPRLHKITSLAHRYWPRLPLYLKNTPPIQRLKYTNSQLAHTRSLVLIPSCPNRIFAAANQGQKHPNHVLLERLGFNVVYPNKLDDLCCGQLYHSQGNHQRAQQISAQLATSLAATEIALLDNSSCASYARKQQLTIYDYNRFICEHILANPEIGLIQRYQQLAVHIDCSTKQQGATPVYFSLLQRLAKKLVTSDPVQCCGFAGAKGFTTPELNRHSLANLPTAISQCQIGVTFNRSCQIGLSEYSGIQFLSLSELILQCFPD